MPDIREALVYTKPNGLRPAWAIFPLRGKGGYVAAPPSAIRVDLASEIFGGE